MSFLKNVRVNRIGTGQDDVIYDYRQKEKVENSHEDYHGYILPLNDGGSNKDWVECDKKGDVEYPEDLLAFELSGASIDFRIVFTYLSHAIILNITKGNSLIYT